MRVGFGAGVITPALPLVLAGFSPPAAAASILDDLEARAIHLVADSGAHCLVVCDLLGMSPDVADLVRSAVGEALGLPRERVLTACTHTHSGPSAMTGSAALGWPTPEGFVDVVVAGCVRAARAASAAAEPATLWHVSAPLPADLSVNRRGLPYDPTFAVLDVRRPDGSRVGALTNVGIHPVALGRANLAISTDWVGPFRLALETAVGGSALLLQGALGDVNPANSHGHEVDGSYDDARALGLGMAAAVAAVLDSAAPLEDSLSVVAARTVAVPIEASALAAVMGVAGELPVELVEWSLGGARLVSVPGEAFHAFGRAVEASRGVPVLLAGLSPHWLGYLPEPFTEGYEESVSFGADAVAAILRALTAG